MNQTDVDAASDNENKRNDLNSKNLYIYCVVIVKFIAVNK